MEGYKHFKGWCCTELAAHWGISLEAADQVGGDELELFQVYFLYVLRNSRLVKKAAADIREFCLAMTRYPVGPVRIWLAISNEECDWDVVCTFRRLVPDAWT
jgi:hypothetical protein